MKKIIKKGQKNIINKIQKNQRRNQKNSKSYESCNGIFINGISYETTEDKLKELFCYKRINK